MALGPIYSDKRQSDLSPRLSSKLTLDFALAFTDVYYTGGGVRRKRTVLVSGVYMNHKIRVRGILIRPTLECALAENEVEAAL